ncbi:hypothetical protein PoB_000399600 [Plakobranchus ocellatus]|uniref:Uncharacterized protein n=1 Tax=Plakobranchus ocellatus TaxID=259542 RepID=A0AAV3Y2S0_9GAST|nr:hypothetical protein PoB_000399600 [Plakobranchus ocellatus]
MLAPSILETARSNLYTLLERHSSPSMLDAPGDVFVTLSQCRNICKLIENIQIVYSLNLVQTACFMSLEIGMAGLSITGKDSWPGQKVVEFIHLFLVLAALTKVKSSSGFHSHWTSWHLDISPLSLAVVLKLTNS